MKCTRYRGQSIKVFDIHKYDGLEMSDSFKELASTLEGQEKIKALCNGVGSEVGFLGNLTYHFIPNTIWFLDITCCSDLHDIDYCYPEKFATQEEAIKCKLDADVRFYNNLVIHIRRNTKNRILLGMRLNRAYAYYLALSNAGQVSFLTGKIIGEILWKTIRKETVQD